MDKTQAILKTLQRRPEIKQPIATDMFLPNHSGVTTHPEVKEVLMPIGAVIAWLKSLTGVPSTLPAGWLECNGQTVSDAESPLNGTALPNLNGSGSTQRYFLRGHTASGTIGGADTHNHSATVSTDSGGAHDHTGTTDAPNSCVQQIIDQVLQNLVIDYTDCDHTHDFTTDSAGAHSHTMSFVTNDSDTIPKNYSVVWIIRIK